jgi:hypothetical protein
VARKKILKKSVSNKDEESMKSKVEIKQPPQKQEKISRLVGSIFIGMGVLLVAFGIFSYIKYREEPLLDPELDAPVLEEVTSITNGETIIVQGQAEGFDTVYIYIDKEKVGETSVDEESKFQFEYTIENEGKYEISIAGVKGFPNRYLSTMSSTKESVVDRTPPNEDEVTFKYGPETNKDTFILVGKTGEQVTIGIKRGADSYEGLTDDEGNFRIENIALEEGKNVFSIYITDMAGNQILLDEKVRVEYTVGGEINGDSVVDEKIPQASGTLEDLFGNRIMMIFGFLALFAFVTSTAIVYKKNQI